MNPLDILKLTATISNGMGISLTCESPEVTIGRPEPSFDNVINQIISSIAMEELALSHVLNAEGEKSQYIINILAKERKQKITVDHITQSTESAYRMLNQTLRTEMLLERKLAGALNASPLKKENIV
jgi:hypothetical protein